MVLPIDNDAQLRNPGLIRIRGNFVVNHLHHHALAHGCGCLAGRRDGQRAALQITDSSLPLGGGPVGYLGASLFLLVAIFFRSATVVGPRSGIRGRRRDRSESEGGLVNDWIPFPQSSS